MFEIKNSKIIKITVATYAILAVLIGFCVFHDNFMKDISANMQKNASALLFYSLNEDEEYTDEYISKIGDYIAEKRFSLFILSEHEDANNIFASFDRIKTARAQRDYSSLSYCASEFYNYAGVFYEKNMLCPQNIF